MQVESLKVFCDLVDTASFSVAAERNGITQSAVSQQIRSLEDRFSTTFFVRGRKNFAVTPEGQIFERAARDMVDSLRVLQEELGSANGSLTGKLRVGAPPSVALYAVREVFDDFRSAHPEVEIDLVYRDRNTICELVSSGSVDFGIIDFEAKHSGLTTEEVTTEPYVLVSPHGHPLSGRKRIRLEAIEGYDFVLPYEGSPDRRMIDRELRKAGVKLGNTVELESVESIRRAVELDGHLALLPESTVRREAEIGILHTAQLSGTTLRRPLTLVQKRTRTVTVAGRELIEQLRSLSG